MFGFASTIIAESQCWSFALRANINIFPQISIFAPEFNFRYLRSGVKHYMSYFPWNQPSSFALRLDMGVTGWY